MKCIIIDDEKMARVSLERLCDKVPGLEVLGVYSSAIEAMSALKILSDFDILFLDIHMPEIDGFDYLKTLNNNAKVIFTTSDPYRAVEAFEVEASDYLIKPVTLPRLLKAIQRIESRAISVAQNGITTKDSSDHYEKEIFVNTDKRLVRIAVDRISIIEAKGDYILLKMDDQKVHIVRSTLKSITMRLDPNNFMKVHRSFIISMSKIVDIEDSSILINNEIVPVSRTMKADLMKRLNLL